MRVASFASRAVRGCAALLGLATAGCVLMPEDRERVIGTISLPPDPVRVEVPDVVTRGTPFEVTVITYGGGCVSEGDTEVQVQGASAVVTPYDIVVHPRGGICTLELKMFDHTASVRFDTPGQAVVTVRGIQEPDGEVVTIQKTVAVQ